MILGLVQAVLDEVSSAFALMLILVVCVVVVGTFVSVLGDPYGVAESFRTAIMLILAIPSGLGILGYIIYRVANSR